MIAKTRIVQIGNSRGIRVPKGLLDQAGVPRIGGNSADNSGYLQVVQTRDSVVLFNEQNHEARIVPLNSQHLPAVVRQWNGDSRGRWDGDALVIDTTNFSSKSMFQGSADGLHLIERFTRVAPGRLDYEVTVDDPATWVRPWTALLWLKEVQDPIYEYACHEGNYDIMRGILSGARFEERSGGAR